MLWTIQGISNITFILRSKYKVTVVRVILKNLFISICRGGSGDYTYAFLADSDADNVVTPPASDINVPNENPVPKSNGMYFILLRRYIM